MSNVVSLFSENQNLESKVELYRDLKRESDALEKKLKSLRKEIISESDGVSEIVNSKGAVICVINTQSRESLSSKSIKEQYPEIYAENVSTTEYKILRLK